MKKADFCASLQDKLREVPLATRQAWEVKDLYIWWLGAKKKDSYLTWERAHGDVWQYVPGMCQSLIGRNAI